MSKLHNNNNKNNTKGSQKLQGKQIYYQQAIDVSLCNQLLVKLVITLILPPVKTPQ